MRYKILLLIAGAASHEAVAKEKNDTVYNPKIVFTGMPQKYEIAGIKVSGVDNYEDYIIIGYSGLTVGQKIDIPGDDLTQAAKRFWRQGLFSKVQIKVTKT